MRGPSALLIITLGVGPSAATAQTAESFEQLRVLVQPGAVVSVTDVRGALSRGRIVDVSNRRLRLQVAAVTREFSENDVREIHQRRGDSLGNGALIGFVSGSAFAAVAVLSSCGSDSDFLCHGGVPAAIIGMWGGLGAGIGVGVDALIVSTHLLYRAPGRSLSMRVMPLLSTGRRGVLVSLSSGDRR